MENNSILKIKLNRQLNPILHTWFRDSRFTCDGSLTIQVCDG
jgi:hypothetical protein